MSIRELREAVEAQLPPGVELWMVRDALRVMSTSEGLTAFQQINARIAAGAFDALLRALEEEGRDG